MRHFILPSAVMLLVSFATVASAADVPEKDGAPARFEEAKALHQQGKHAEALAVLQTHRPALPPNARLTRWQLDFERRAVPVVLIGKKHVYFTTDISRGERPGPLRLPDGRPVLNDSKSVYDFNTAITCVEAATGKKLWTRQTAGYFNVAVDPRTYHLYCWRDRLYRLKPDNGEVDLEKDLPGHPNQVEAILIGGRPFVPRPRHNMPYDASDPLQTYNVETGQVARTNVSVPLRLAPDESKMLLYTLYQGERVTTQIAAQPVKRDDPKFAGWKYEHPDYSYSEPFWLGDDVVALNGHPTSKGEVVRLKGTDGSVRWRFVLPRGAYAPGQDQLPGNAYPPRSWSALGLCGEHLLALGGEGTLYFLNPDSGKLNASASLTTSHLCFPRLSDGVLVVAGIDGIRAVSMDVLFNRLPYSERDVALLQARCLTALGRVEEAMKLLRPVLELEPAFKDGWAELAELARKLNRPHDEIAARCRCLDLSGEETSPRLRERWGLLRRIATRQDITADLKRAGDLIYAGTRSGTLIGIDMHSLQVVERKEFPAAIGRLNETVRLTGGFNDRLKRVVAEHDGEPKPYGVNGPAAWNTYTGYDGRVVRWEGKHYRPLGGGGVRVLDGQNVTEHKTPLTGIKQWQLLISPWGPLGYGTGGVFELDKDLCPTRRLIDTRDGQADSQARSVYHLATDGRSLGLVTYNGKDFTIQVWPKDGKQMLREEALVSFGSWESNSQRLVPLGGGYFFSGGELAWVPASADTPAWHFGVGPAPGRSVPKVHYAHTMYFGPPLVNGNLLFAPCRDGAVYVFDVNAITRPAPR